jgi:hypothetical protein
MRLPKLLFVVPSCFVLACSGREGDPPAVTADAAVSETIVDEARPDYPPPPYGAEVGDTFPLLTMRGRKGGAAEFVEISSRDYYDPDGDRGIRALWVGVNFFCDGCDETHPFAQLPMHTATAYTSPPTSYAERGARMVDLIAPTRSGINVGNRAVDGWIKQFGSRHDVAAFSDAQVLATDGNLPHCFVVDPRSMKIVHHAAATSTCEDQVYVILEEQLIDHGAPPRADAGSPDAADSDAVISDAASD